METSISQKKRPRVQPVAVLPALLGLQPWQPWCLEIGRTYHYCGWLQIDTDIMADILILIDLWTHFCWLFLIVWLLLKRGNVILDIHGDSHMYVHQHMYTHIQSLPPAYNKHKRKTTSKRFENEFKHTNIEESKNGGFHAQTSTKEMCPHLMPEHHCTLQSVINNWPGNKQTTNCPIYSELTSQYLMWVNHLGHLGISI